MTLARHCSGGVILGFSQFKTSTGVWKAGTPNQRSQKRGIEFPTPWNHIEAGILFALQLPLIVFRDETVSGGIFDEGVSDLFIQPMPKGKLSRRERRAIQEVLRKWSAAVHAHYYV
jgi:hypothetical protein